MKLTKILPFIFVFTLLFNVACDDAEIVLPQETYENGIFIANEGNFGTPNAEVTYVSRDLTKIQQNIFSGNNDNSNLGDVLQTIAINNGKTYLVLNNSNKIQIVDPITFKKSGEITDQINQPRYIAFANNSVYVTNDKYNGDKYVSIYNSANSGFIKKIPFTDTVERIVEAGGNIFVQNASYGVGNKITYINTTTNAIQSVITLPNGNINKTISKNSNVYAITAGTTDSYIYQISSAGNITKTVTLTGITNATNLDIFDNKYYFTSGNKVYSMDMNTTTAPTSPLFTVTDNSYSTLYGFNVIDGQIFTSDANGFTQDSKVTVYSTSGSVIKSFPAGKGTNGFYVN